MTLPERRVEGAPVLDPRYADMGVIGQGGMGEVRRVWDRHLDRPVAMKLMRLDQVAAEEQRARFLAEARLTAGLQHPGIIAVHDLGELADGRVWFAMREVRGRDLAELMRQDRVPFRRRIEIFARVCSIVAYAHERGIVHRDLKPENVMVGEFGEVHVVDWGIAVALADRPSQQIVGTPAYMSPEQARGGVLTPASDVYALGVMLRETLTGLLPPNGTVTALLRQVAVGPPPPVTGVAADRVELATIAERAMAPLAADRFANALALGRAVEGWLDGTQQTERARGLTTEAVAELGTLGALRQQAEMLRAEALDLLSGLDPHAADAEKRGAWQLEDDAATLDREAAGAEARFLQRLQAALTLSPDLAECHDLLADHHREQAERARGRRDGDAAALHRLLVQTHDRSGRHVAWLARRGYLSLTVQTPEARISVHRHRTHGRRKHLEFKGFLPSPARRELLAAGTYTLAIQAPGHDELRLLLVIEAGQDCDRRRPGSLHADPVHLPPAGTLTPDVVLVPAGWFIAGGDPAATDGLPRRRLWLDAFIIERCPVTLRQYATFLNAVAATGEDVAPWLPQDRHGPRFITLGEAGYAPAPGDEDLPVALITWYAAQRYAAWRVAETGQPWRLPHDLEWEKAARGVDGRSWPWGEHAEPTWAQVAGSSSEPPGPASVFAGAVDVSPVGARGMVGNVRDWCANPYDRRGPPEGDCIDPLVDPGGELRFIRGGNWGASLVQCRPAGRYAAPPDSRYLAVGFRLVRSWPG
ncbi:MAG: SUMF1/EgtB/PvdO family nonheme iron enzyme [Myxococcales bacterium]|nr:SUMF1/EgtB/PvdO family nonheme iron enzyme [Myxococcales bacterium]